MNRAGVKLLNDRLSSWLLMGVLTLGLTSCNQTPTGGPVPPTGSGPWNVNSNPYAGAPGGENYLAYLQSQADHQAQLAAEQNRRIAELQAMQRQSEQQLADAREQQQRAAERASQEQADSDALVTQRAREALGKYDELDRRVRGLDRSNAELQARIAQVHQRNELLEDQNHLLRRQLEETSQQLAVAIDATQQSEQKLDTIVASTRRRSGASITANNSYRRNLTAVSVAGLSIRQDGELVRIELPSDQLFENGTAKLRPDAVASLDNAADVILKNYPRQIVGVEAHCDNSPLAPTMWRNPHQLTAAQSMSVFEYLSYRHKLLPQQMFILGHGQNYPLASNATAAGQARNRRVEIVIYPEQVGQR